MNIEEYWARLVAAGLAPDWKNVCAVYDGDKSIEWKITDDGTTDIMLSTNIVNSVNGKAVQGSATVQLRKDGKDLFKLKWRTIPLEAFLEEGEEQRYQDRMRWLLIDGKYIVKRKVGWIETESESYGLNEKEIYWDADGKDLAYKSLMADHGDIAPTLEDFKEVYMRQ